MTKTRVGGVVWKSLTYVDKSCMQDFFLSNILVIFTYKSKLNLMRRVEMTPDHKLIWDTLTKEQINIITIFVVNYYDENEVDYGHEAFKDVLMYDVIDASSYLTVEQYLIFRTISDYQKLAVYTNYVNYEEKYCAELMADYSVDETVAAAGYDYTVFVLHNLFTDTNLLNFRFFQN